MCQVVGYILTFTYAAKWKVTTTMLNLLLGDRGHRKYLNLTFGIAVTANFLTLLSVCRSEPVSWHSCLEASASFLVFVSTGRSQLCSVMFRWMQSLPWSGWGCMIQRSDCRPQWSLMRATSAPCPSTAPSGRRPTMLASTGSRSEPLYYRQA